MFRSFRARLIREADLIMDPFEESAPAISAPAVARGMTMSRKGCLFRPRLMLRRPSVRPEAIYSCENIMIT
jgi:hypothetical protein